MTEQTVVQGKLDALAAHENHVTSSPFTRVVRRLGQTAQFAAVYRRVGPVIDPRIAHLRQGRVMARVYGFPMLLLHTTGAKSGAPRMSPLLYVRDGDDLMLVGTNFGHASHPAWTANLRAHPEAAVEVGPVRLLVVAEQVDDATWELVFPSFVAVYPGYAQYLVRRGDLPPRMFRLRVVG